MKPVVAIPFAATLARIPGVASAVLALMLSAYPERPAFALGFPVVGWGYSIGNTLYRLGDPRQPPIGRPQGFGWWFNPPAPGLILSGKLSVQYDPSWTVGGAGWFGEFGANPLLPPPPIGSSEVEESLLQPAANPLMLSASIATNAILGQTVFNFDWGPDGFLTSADHLNFAGIWFSNLMDPSSPPAATDLRILGGPGDVRRNGTGAQTYMLCRSDEPGSESFFCGEFSSAEVPEPFTLALFGAGLVGLAGMRRRRKRA